MRILVVNQYFHPDIASTSQLLTELCEDLAAHHEVTVVAGRPSYNPVELDTGSGIVSEERLNGIRVLRTWSTRYPRGSMAGRVTNYATYLASCVVGIAKVDRPDVVLTMTDPPVVALAAMLASRAYRRPFVYINQDIFPQVAVALGQLRSPIAIRALSRLNRLIRGKAARVVAIAPEMRRRLVQEGTTPGRIMVIRNWADGSVIKPLSGPSRLKDAMGWSDRFVVMHSGNVGFSQSLQTLLMAADRLRHEEGLVFAVIGDGAMKSVLERRAGQLGLRNVEFLPYQPKASLSDSLGAADVHIVSLRRGLSGFIVPSKVYGIMAAGKPFVAAVEPDSEPARIIREGECGVRTEPDDPRALAEAVMSIRGQPLDRMGRRARRLFEERFDRPIATSAYRELLEEVAGARHG